jgi:hypothetical protein
MAETQPANTAPREAAPHDDGADTPRVLTGLRACYRRSHWARWDPFVIVAKLIVAKLIVAKLIVAIGSLRRSARSEPSS